MGCKKLTYHETLSPLKVVCSNLNISGISCVGSYRYGFNGMEGDPEVKGNGNSYTTEFRQYDPRVGRWLSLDPLMAKYPHQSGYAAFNNNPIYFTDPTGLEGEDPETMASKSEKIANEVIQRNGGKARGLGDNLASGKLKLTDEERKQIYTTDSDGDRKSTRLNSSH